MGSELQILLDNLLAQERRAEAVIAVATADLKMIRDKRAATEVVMQMLQERGAPLLDEGKVRYQNKSLKDSVYDVLQRNRQPEGINRMAITNALIDGGYVAESKDALYQSVSMTVRRLIENEQVVEMPARNGKRHYAVAMISSDKQRSLEKNSA